MSPQKQPLMSERMPVAIEAERVILGSILVGNVVAKQVFDTLSSDMFFLPAHTSIYRQLQELYEAGLPTDMTYTVDGLMKSLKLQEVGGAAYVTSLTDAMPVQMNISATVKLVVEKFFLRRIAHTCELVQGLAMEQSVSPAKLLDEIMQRFSDMSADTLLIEELGKTYFQAGADFLLSIDAEKEVRIFSGVNLLDEMTGGFRPGELITITAETGVGKTIFASQIRRHSCRRGAHSLYCSGEMLAHHLIARDLAAFSHVPQWKMRRIEALEHSEVSRITQAVAEECQKCKILDGELSLANIRRTARHMKNKGPLGMVVVDYDELVEVKGKDEWEQQKNLARAAKSLSMELRCPVVVISQLRKALQGQERQNPTLHRLYGSGAKAKHSSIVIYVDREYVETLVGDETKARIVVLKNRDGRIGKMDAIFDIERLAFKDAPDVPRDSERADTGDGEGRNPK